MTTIHNPLIQVLTLAAAHTSASGTNTVETFEGPINYQYHGVLLKINRTAETGTCTLDVKLQGYNTLTATWYDVPLASCVQFADAATGHRLLMLYPTSVGDTEIAGDLRGTQTISNDKYVQGLLPRQWRAHVTNGGTTVTNTYSIEAELLV